MPSNADYKKQAEELAEELNIAIDTDGLNNEKLGALVSDLRAKKKDADTLTQADKVIQGPEVETTVEPKKPPFYVMPGKAITSKRGILADGDEIKAEDLAGGKEALDAFITSRHVGES